MTTTDHSPDTQDTEKKHQYYLVAKEIAQALAETDRQAFKRIMAGVYCLGPEQARALVARTEEIEASGGLMTNDGSRRRTKGGVWFFLAKQAVAAIDPQLVSRLTGVPRRPTQRQTSASQQETHKEQQAAPSLPQQKKMPRAEPPASPTSAMRWADRLPVLALFKDTTKGTATVKITVIGRPLNFSHQGTCVVAILEGREPTNLPKGLPTPPAERTQYSVYISSKQWKSVVDSLQDPADVLIVEGVPQLDKETGTIAVFATNTTTKLLQQAKRQQQPQAKAAPPA